MNPTVTAVSERKILDNRGAVSTAIVLTYMVGSFGPFSLVTSQAEIQSGTAAQKMQQFAQSLATLPQQQGS